jgi:hypothetical protein
MKIINAPSKLTLSPVWLLADGGFHLNVLDEGLCPGKARPYDVIGEVEKVASQRPRERHHVII